MCVSKVTRALLVRGHSLSASFVDKFFELFDDAEVSWDAARALGAIVSSDKILTKRNHAIIKVRIPVYTSRREDSGGACLL